MNRTHATLALFGLGFALFVVALWMIGSDAHADRSRNWEREEARRIEGDLAALAEQSDEALSVVHAAMEEFEDAESFEPTVELWAAMQAALGELGVSPETRVELYRPHVHADGGATFLGAVTRAGVEHEGEGLLIPSIRAPEAALLEASEDGAEEDLVWFARVRADGPAVELHRVRSMIIEHEWEVEEDEHDDEDEEHDDEHEEEDEHDDEHEEEEDELIEIRPYLLHVITPLPTKQAQALSLICEQVGDKLGAEAVLRPGVGAGAAETTRLPLEIEALEGRRPTSIEGPIAFAEIGPAPDPNTGPLVVAFFSILAFAAAIVVGLFALAKPKVTRPADLTSEAAHEMRTPLTVMRGKLEVALRRERDPAYYRQTIAECLEEVSALEQLQDAVLLLGRTRRADLVQEDIDLRAIADAEVSRVAEAHPERDVSLAMNGAVVVQGDPSLLARAIGNLIDNAANHSIDGGAIRVTVGSRGGKARVVVEDAGPGVPPERHEAIFDRFYRGPDVGRRGIAGSGLGLPIVRRIAELHGGTAAIEPADGVGRFVLILPSA